MDQERAVLAVFHKVGRRVRIVQDKRLYEVFDRAADTYPDVFGSYSLDPTGHDYLRLAILITRCVRMGVIDRDYKTLALKASMPLANGYGANLFYDLDSHVKACVMDVAAQLRGIYDHELDGDTP